MRTSPEAPGQADERPCRPLPTAPGAARRGQERSKCRNPTARHRPHLERRRCSGNFLCLQLAGGGDRAHRGSFRPRGVVTTVAQPTCGLAAAGRSDRHRGIRHRTPNRGGDRGDADGRCPPARPEPSPSGFCRLPTRWSPSPGRARGSHWSQPGSWPLRRSAPRHGDR